MARYPSGMVEAIVSRAYSDQMDLETAELLVSPQGAAALDAAMAESDPGSLAAATRLRGRVPAGLAAAALTQAVLRRKAVGKIGKQAAQLLFTPAGLEQATRWDVATWRAELYAQAGVQRVVDLCCGLGIDAMAFARAGLEVVGVERDPATAVLADFNLGSSGNVLVASAEDVADELLRQPGTAVFCDPARRTDHGRSWNVSDLSPPWAFVESLLDGSVPAAVKLGPGFPDALIPPGVDAAWVSVRGDLVECSLWRGIGPTRLRREPASSLAMPSRLSGVEERGDELSPQSDRREAVLLPSGERLGAASLMPPPADRAPVPGDIVYEPASAVTRSGASARLAVVLDARPIASRVAYLLAENYTPTPFATAFEISAVMAWKEQIVRSWVAAEGIGTLEIKVRGLDVDPAALRRRLRLKGPSSATIMLTPVLGGAACMVVRRKN